MTPSKPVKVLRAQTNWERLYFYQKTVVLYQMTYIFCQRFLPKHGDRTVDQMVQAARSGKQNIVEGCADGVTSTEMELKLLNVEELANCANTLCHMVDRMLTPHLSKKEADFTENGGIRERMTAARLGRRQTQNEEIAALKTENASLRREIAALKARLREAGQ